ncbi:MAG: Gfo/Idh/MocA family oxidoreductase [Sedimentisphaerales bacterium]|nr:Gfo/Idh/MocA family oxidoreductase [Sedimentisphaerales bacterium]
MLRIGIAGFGFMGRTHYQCWDKVEGAEVAAICETNPNIVEDTKKAVGNIGDAQRDIDFSKLDIYTDYDKMLAEAGLDAVSITLPTILHPEFSCKALAAGVHVMCEKPMALNVGQCERMISAAEKSGKVLQIGHCVRFWPEYAKAKEIIDSGKYGKVLAASFRRLGSAPTWSADNWFGDDDRSGGMALDLHIHDTDYVQYLFGMPRAVSSVAGKGPGGGLAHIATEYIYDEDIAVVAEGGWAMMPSFGFEMSFNIMLEKATILFDITRNQAFKLCVADGEPLTPEVEAGDGWLLQIKHFAKAIAGEKVEPVTTLHESRESVRIVAAEKKSAQRKKIVDLD